MPAGGKIDHFAPSSFIKGSIPYSAALGLVSVDAPDVVISAIKRAEDSNDLIMRMYETGGRTTKATLINLSFLHDRWKEQFYPYEIETLRIEPKMAKIVGINILER